MGLAVGDEEVTDEDLIAVARSWVIKALTSVTSGGDRGHYNKLLNDLRDPRLNDPASAPALSIRLMALSQTVSYMDERAHQGLLSYLLGMSVWGYSEEVVEALLAIVVNLSTANGSFVPECLDMMVRNFLPPSCGLPNFLDSFSRTGLMMGFMTVEKLRMQAGEHLAKKDSVSLLTFFLLRVSVPYSYILKLGYRVRIFFQVTGLGLGLSVDWFAVV